MKALRGNRLVRNLALSSRAIVFAVRRTPQERRLHNSARCFTDGVYQELTAMRVKTPYIEALKKQQEDGADTTKKFAESTKPSERDLSPKKMSDSYHKVVRYSQEIITYLSGSCDARSCHLHMIRGF